MILALVDTGWSNILRERPEYKDLNTETIFKAMDSVMLIMHPISIRRFEYETMTMKDGEDPGNFIRRIQAEASAADMKNCPLEAQMLLKDSQKQSCTEA